MHKKGNVKLKILFFFVFFTAFIFLAAWLARFYISSKEKIDEGLEESRCINYDFEIKEIQYENNRLIFEIINNKLINEPISTVQIVVREGTINYSLDKELNVGESSFVDINDVEIEDSITIYVQDCPIVNKTYNI